MAKKCSKCGIEKDVSGFYRGNGRLGLRSQCMTCEIEYSAMDKKRNPEKYLAKARRVNKKRREAVLLGLGGDNPKCKCCGENEKRFLCVDHIKNNGADERRKYGSAIYLEVKKKGFPKGEYQLLCHNCNMARAFYKVCPHQNK